MLIGRYRRSLLHGYYAVMLKVEHCLEEENGKQAVKKAGKHCQKGESDRQKGEADVGQAKSLARKAK